MRIESMTLNLRSELREVSAQLQQMKDHNAARLVGSLASELAFEQHVDQKPTSSELVVKPHLSGDFKQLPPGTRDHFISITVTAIPSQGSHGHCPCRCHYRNTSRSPKALDRIAGVLFAGYSGFPCLAPPCNVNSCRNSCPMTTKSVASVKYFFPSWFLSWAVSLWIRSSEWGFDYNVRFMHCVSYSSPIFVSAYRGDAASMKMLLKAKRGSPFDVTAGARQKSLLTVLIPRMVIFSFS